MQTTTSITVLVQLDRQDGAKKVLLCFNRCLGPCMLISTTMRIARRFCINCIKRVYEPRLTPGSLKYNLCRSSRLVYGVVSFWACCRNLPMPDRLTSIYNVSRRTRTHNTSIQTHFGPSTSIRQAISNSLKSWFTRNRIFLRPRYD